MKEKDEILDEALVYEVGFHILPTVEEEKLGEVVLKIKDLVSQNGGEIIADDFPKMRALAYDIKKRIETKYSTFSKAYFGWVKFETLPASIEQIEKEMKINPNVLRFIIVKTVRENTMNSPKIPMTAKGVGAIEEPKSVDAVPVEKVEVSEEEIDKSIDELLVSEA